MKFIRWEPDEKPQVTAATEGGKDIFKVTVPDPILGSGWNWMRIC